MYWKQWGQLYQTGHECIEDKTLSLKPSQIFASSTLVLTWTSLVILVLQPTRRCHRQQIASLKVRAFYYQNLMHKMLSTMRVSVHNHCINYLCKDEYKALTSCENRQRE